MLNQDIHKNLRRNKHGIRLDDIEKLPAHYKRPAGFSVVPGLLGTALANATIVTASQTKDRNASYFEHVQEEMQG